MNQLTLEDDDTCKLKSGRTKLDFPVPEHLALNHGFRQVGFVRPLEELREKKQNTKDMDASYAILRSEKSSPL